MKSKAIVKVPPAKGSGGVVRPRAVVNRVTFHQWLTKGVSASWILPTTWVHRCRVSQLAPQADRGRSGQAGS